MAPEANPEVNPEMEIFSEDMVQKRPGPLNDFIWKEEEHPHVTRRLAILKAHPEVKTLYGYDPITIIYVLVFVAIQFISAYLVKDIAFTWQFWAMAYVVGATCNHALFLSIHEIGHNLAFKSITANRLFSMFANLPVGLPYAISFKAYHNEHHKLQGVEGYDTDLPTWVEGIIFRNVFTKTFFCATQILFYALRPMVIRFQQPNLMLLLNWIIQLSFDAVIIYLFGWGPLCYFLASSFLAGSLHPCAGHFISEHYVFTGSHETFSYYGPLNAISFNVGYHNEHHDFPNIPWTRLPMLKEMAPEFYNNLPYHTSWMMVTYYFITDFKMSVYNRVKRQPTERDLATAQKAALSDYHYKTK